MKLSLACLAVAAAVDTEAPVISLDLAEERHPYKLAKRIKHENAISGKTGLPLRNGAASYQDYSVRCAAGTSSATECPSPTASAYDHHDGVLTVTTRLFLVNQRPSQPPASTDGDGLPRPITPPVFTPDMYKSRGTYLFKYDATDMSGNDAEQVVFALILDDLEAPVITYRGNGSDVSVLDNEQIIEASSDWRLDTNTTVSAEDNVDLDVSPTLKYKVERLNVTAEGNVFIPYLDEDTVCSPSDTEDCYQSKTDASQVINTSRVCDTCHTSNTCLKPACVYRVTMKANDYAGIYGHDGQDNVRTHAVTLEVRDTRKPVIHVLGKSPKSVECVKQTIGSVYQELFSDGVYRQNGTNDVAATPADSCNTDDNHDYCASGAQVFDLLQTEIEGDTIPYSVNSDVDMATAGTNYTISFNAADDSLNYADTMTRTVMVLDTLKPTITLVHPTVTLYTWDDDTNTANYEKTNTTQGWGALTLNDNMPCEDQCDPNPTVTHRWNMLATDSLDADAAAQSTSHRSGIEMDENGNPKHAGPGTYVQTFTCTDFHNNTRETSRTYIVEDTDQPMITLIDNNQIVMEKASKDDLYTDSGARCSDYSDGQIDHQVVISGDVVNMRVPGNYTIKFDCEDSNGNLAATVYRTVIVYDTECPYLTLHGQDITTIEAGFPYEDVGATATDTLDGDLTPQITQTGNSSAAHFLTMKSCQEIKEQVAVHGGTPNNGMYNILTKTASEDKHRHQPVYCDFDSDDSAALTIFTTKTSNRVQPYRLGIRDGPSDECKQFGLVMPTVSWVAQHKDVLKAYADSIDGGNCRECIFPDDNGQMPDGDTTDYLCTATTTADIDGHISGTEHYNKHYSNTQAENEEILKGKPEGRTIKTYNDLLNGIGGSDVGGTVDGMRGQNVADSSWLVREIENDATLKEGTFTVTFMVKDYAGNGCSANGCTSSTTGGDCTDISQETRTIVVKDTLPPVITLTLKDKLIQTSDASQRGVNGVYNPAGRQTQSLSLSQQSDYSKHHHSSGKGHKSIEVKGNPFLDVVNLDTHKGAQSAGSFMAEQTATNGWIIAAAASAVAGVALMGYSMKAAPVTVPV
jgi:hypothetical protein